MSCSGAGFRPQRGVLYVRPGSEVFGTDGPRKHVATVAALFFGEGPRKSFNKIGKQKGFRVGND